MRGFLFTAGLVITALVVLSLSFFLMSTGYREIGNTAEVLGYDQMNNQVNWIGSGFSGIVASAGVNISVEGSSVIIDERLPNPFGADYTDNIDDWALFVQSASSLPVTIDTVTIRDNMPLVIRPSSVTYTHPGGVSGNSIRVENANQVGSYRLDMDINMAEDVTLNWVTQNPGTDLLFRLDAHANNDQSVEAMLDPAQTSVLTVTLPSGTITVSIGDTNDLSLLAIENPSALDTSLSTNITLSTSIDPTVTFPDDVVRIRSGKINASTSSPVLIG